MLVTIVSVSAILLSAMLVMMGYGLQTTILPLRAEMEGFSDIAIGLAGSLYSVGFVAGCLLAPYAILRAGHIRAFAALISVASAIALLHVLVIDPWPWALFRAMTGFCIAGFFLCVESWMNDRADNQTRGFILSSYIVVVSVGIIAGQSMVALGDVGGFALFAIGSIIVSAAVVPIAMTQSAQPAPITLVRLRPIRFFETSPTAFFAILAIGLSTGSLLALAPIYATSSGYSAPLAAVFTATVFAGGTLMQWPLGRLSDLTDRRYVLIGCATGVMVTGTLLGLFIDSNLTLILILAALVGAFNQPGYAIASAHAFDYADPGDYVETASSVLLMYGIGAAVGPAVAATLMQQFGPSFLFYFIVFIQTVLVCYLMLRVSKRPALAAAEKESFDYASTAPVVAVGQEEAWEQSDQILVPEEYEEREVDEVEAGNPVAGAEGGGETRAKAVPAGLHGGAA